MLVPSRPDPYVWVLPPASDWESLVRAISDAGAAYRFDVVPADDARGVEVFADRTALERAAEDFDSDRVTIDPPTDGHRYRFVIARRKSLADDLRPGFEVEPIGDNWAAWPVVGPFAERVANALGALEITGDPPMWMQQALAREEPPLVSPLPLLPLRVPTLFPGFAGEITFGRAAPIQVIDALLAAKVEHLVLVVQSDSFEEAAPTSRASLESVGLYARFLRARREGNRSIVALKGIERVQVSAVDFTSSPPTAVVAATPRAARRRSPADLPALREFARRDARVAAEAGSSLVRAIDRLPIGTVADLVAKTSGDIDLARRAFVELDEGARAQLVNAVVQDG